ncbi:MAG: T9SS type A sorting domain-containing protein [Bacteroidota bacterium]|nr:T9SS type A sorting domain-containing protein [Bacteroidota bacterium]
MKQLLLTCFAAFTTGYGLFAQISTFPHTTNFETEALCGTSCTGACDLTGDWKNGDQYGFPQAGTDWLAEDGSTPSTTTGPDIDHTIGNATGKYAYVETSGCNNVTAHLVSAVYDFTAVSSPKIKFWYHMFGATMGTMHVDVDTSGLGNWVLDITPSWTDNVDLWQLKTVSLSNFAGKPNVRIRIRSTTGTSFTSDMAVDDIEVFQPLAEDLNAHNVSAGGGCGNSINTPVILTMINAGSNPIPAGTPIPLAFMINTTTVLDTFVTTGIIAASDTFNYTFQTGFADLSGPGQVTIKAWTSWTPDVSFGNDTTTNATFGIPIITSYPYFQDFETGQNGWLINSGTLGTWAFGTPAKTTIIGAASGLNAFVTGGLGTGFYNDLENSYVQGPCFDFTTICDPVISLNVWYNSEFSWDGMNIMTSTDGGTTWNLVGDFGDPLNWYTDNTIVGAPGGSQTGWSGRASTTNGSGGWINARHRLVGLGGMSNVKIKISFGTDGSVTDDGVAFDDIHIFNGTDFGMDKTICDPATMTLNAYHGNPSATYLWNDGTTLDNLTVDTTGWYTVAITADITCTTTDSIYVVVVDTLTAPTLGLDSTTCANGVMLNAGYFPQSTYLWSTGDTTQMINATMSASYIAYVITPCDTITDTVMITINPKPVVALGNDSSFCDSATIIAGVGTDTYMWNTGATTPSITTAMSGPYSVDVTNSFGCINSDTITVVVNSLPVVNLGTDSTQCGGSIVLDAGTFSSYTWSNSDVTQTTSVSTSGAYNVVVTDMNGCENSDTVTITINTPPTAGLSLAFTTACVNNAPLGLSGGTPTGGNYSGTGVTGTDFDPAAAGSGTHIISYIYADANGCSDTATQSVTVDPCIGLKETFAGMELSVFPNPSNGIFSIELNGVHADLVNYTVTDARGRIVKTSSVDTRKNAIATSLDLSDFDNGVYFLLLNSGNSNKTIKLVLNK